MRIILVGSVGTVKRLRISLGTLVAIEATFDATRASTEVTAAEGFGSGAPAPVKTVSFTMAVAETDVDVSATIAEAAIARAFAAIEQVNRLMHPQGEGSDLARINSAPLHIPTKVHASVGQLLNLARRINTLTDGVFDPCTPARPGRINDIEISADETEVVCHEQVALDFGGFAKGYAVDCAIEALIAGGCTAGLVNAGGDLRVFGHRTEPLFVRGPRGDLTNIELTNAALAVSDAASEQRPPEHQGYYDRNQQSTRLTVTYAAVVASTAAVADALAKCVLLCPPSAGTRVLDAFGATQPLLATASNNPPP